MATSPIPTLVHHCGYKLDVIAQIYGQKVYVHELNSMARSSYLAPKFMERFFVPTMMEWGKTPDTSERKHLLWKCYFPDTKPTVLHILYFVHEVPMFKLCDAMKMKEASIMKLIRRPKMQQKHLRRIGRFASEYLSALSSKRQQNGPDDRSTGLWRALHDTNRLYAPGEIIVD